MASKPSETSGAGSAGLSAIDDLQNAVPARGCGAACGALARLGGLRLADAPTQPGPVGRGGAERRLVQADLGQKLLLRRELPVLLDQLGKHAQPLPVGGQEQGGLWRVAPRLVPVERARVVVVAAGQIRGRSVGAFCGKNRASDRIGIAPTPL